MNKIFVDTNILVYLATDKSEKQKQIIEFFQSHDAEYYISYQVLNEFTAVSLKKKFLEADKIIQYIEEFVISFELIEQTMLSAINGIRIQQSLKYSYYDSLIISMALESACSTLLTEDLQHDQLVEDRLRIISPFKIKT